MLAAYLTTICFSLGVILAARATRIVGPRGANLGRLSIATVLLAIYAHSFGAGVEGPAFSWFFLSGVIGFGLGDMALFGALPRIGPRLSILLTQCLAAPIAAVAEWLWLGTALDPSEMLWAAVILAGVALALAPDHGWEGSRRVFWVGVLFGVGSAMGQAFGAVLSRKANVVAVAAGFPIDGGSAAYQRILGGILMTGIGILLLGQSRQNAEVVVRQPLLARWKKGWPFVLGHALAGPTIGVACYQWALKTTPSGIVLPIVAASPLVTMIFAFWIDGLKPTVRATVGGLVAVAGAIVLARVRA